jgi:adenine-specific DNA methylase
MIYPKRLIEVDLPIKRISAHARREKFIRHGHISTLHIWWARRSLAACRAVICAALWPDPANVHCPAAFIQQARESTFGETKVSRVGETALDRVHQSMILFAAGRSEALKRFLVDDGIGNDARFWSLAQALSALYPSSTEEKRWGDGVLARKKGLGF